MAGRLALVPATAKRAEGVAFEVRLERGAASASEMISVDLKVGAGCSDGCWVVGAGWVPGAGSGPCARWWGI